MPTATKHDADASGCHWTKVDKGINLAMRHQFRTMLDSERCKYRYATIHDAKAACEASSAWCGGVARDAGLACRGATARLQFELRLNSTTQGSFSMAYAGPVAWVRWCGPGPEGLQPYESPPLTLPPWHAPGSEVACVARCPRLRDLFIMIMTTTKFHNSRGRLIKQTYLAQLPPTHYTFYSDSDDPTLPAVRAAERPFPGAMPATGPYMRAQLRWPDALTKALAASRALGTRWTMVVDDDTFVIPSNVIRVLRRFDPTSPTALVGQRCPAVGGVPRLCGGAGWVMSSPLHAALVRTLPNCTARSRARPEAHSDAFLSGCMHDRLGVDVADSAAFNSRPPAYYEDEQGQLDRPGGYGAPATFHYIKSQEEWTVLHHLTSWATAGSERGKLHRGHAAL